MGTQNYLENLGQQDLPEDIQRAVEGMDVSADLVRRYCGGPRVERSVARAAIAYSPPETPTHRVAVGVLDLEELLVSA